jgi:integrase
MAFDNKVVDIQPPRRKTLNLPMIDNERTRAFTTEQAQKYFEHMDVRSKQWADITRASLFAGLRASEVLRLKVKDFDEQRGRLFLLSPKKQKSQNLVLNDSAFQLFKRLKEEHPTKEGLFFAIQNGERKGEQITEVSNTIQRAIDELGFNAGVTDRRDKLTFHSWRHTHATWLIDQGVDIHTVSALLRHSTLAMTRRYVHPHEEKLRNASRGIDNVFNVTGDQVNTGTEGNG